MENLSFLMHRQNSEAVPASWYLRPQQYLVDYCEVYWSFSARSGQYMLDKLHDSHLWFWFLHSQKLASDL